MISDRKKLIERLERIVFVERSLFQISGRKPLNFDILRDCLYHLQKEEIAAKIAANPVKSENKDVWVCCGGIELTKEQSCPFCGEPFSEDKNF